MLFLHDFGGNTFLGSRAGNLTMSGSGGNTAIGEAALQSNTTGSANTASGYRALVTARREIKPSFARKHLRWHSAFQLCGEEIVEADRSLAGGDRQQEESILAENEMGETTLVAFRLENELLKRIDAYAERLEGNIPGLKLTRVDAVRVLLLRGLAQVEEPEASGKKRS